MDKLLETYPVKVDLKVAWGEMDAFGHVNNIIYFRYFETARIVYFEKLNYPEMIKEERIGPILASTDCNYKIPLVYPDTITVGTKTIDIKEDRFTMKYAVVSHKHGRIAAIGSGVIVSYDYGNNIKIPLPEKIREHIIKLEGL